MLAAQRAAIAADLTTAGIKALGYVGEVITPPCALVVPAEPYLRKPAAGAGIPFRRVKVGIDVLLLVPRDGGAKAAAELIDDLIEDAYRALNPNHDISTASRPGVVTVSGSKYLGSVLSIEALSEEP